MRASRAEVIRPKLELTLRPSAPGWNVVFGNPRLTRLVTLKASALSCSFILPRKRHLLQERQVDVEDARRARIRQCAADVTEFEVRRVHERVGVEPPLRGRVLERGVAEIIRAGRL